jgi:hypothetical protein
MPEHQMLNATDSDKMAKSIFDQLVKKYKTSTYPQEKGGLIPEQNLIALGSSDTLLPSVRSVLIEYSYIYEKALRTKAARMTTFQNMANLTAAGIINYFFHSTPPSP